MTAPLQGGLVLRALCVASAAAWRSAPAAPAAVAEEANATLGYELHGTFVPDAFAWLENDTDARVLGWASARDQEARAMLAQEVDGVPSEAQLATRLQELLESESMSPPKKYGDRTFFAKIGLGDEKPTYYVKDAGHERVLVNTSELAGRIGAWAPSWDGAKVAYRYHPESNDAAVLVVLDVESGEKVAELPGARYANPSWEPNSQGFFFTFLPELPAGMPEQEWVGLQQVVFWELPVNGTQKDHVVVVKPSHDPQSFVSAWVTRDGRFLLRSRSAGWGRNSVECLALPRSAAKYDWGKLGDQWTLLHDPRDGGAGPAHFNGTFFLFHRGETAPRGRVLSMPDDEAGKRGSAFTELVAQQEDVLDSFQIVGGRLFLRYLQDVRPHLVVLDLKGERIEDLGLPEGHSVEPTLRGRGLGFISDLSGDAEDDVAYFSAEKPLHPPVMFELTVGTGKNPSSWKEWFAPKYPNFKAGEGYQVEQHFVPSGDVKVPLTLIRPKKLLRGPMRTILYGYGGFGLTQYARFTPTRLAWLELGGAYCVAGLRGGGEYGDSWHAAGRGPEKQHVFDDFAKAAEHLQEAGVTTNRLLMAEGGSNGGLLAGAALVQRPDLFGAVVSKVPLLDMVRYPKFDAGVTWVPEYGDPNNATEFQTLLRYSPFHHVAPKSEQEYPPALLMSTWKDDRVSPMHARKFAARLQAQGQEAYLRVEKGGHGGVAERSAYAKAVAASWSFGLHHLQERPVGVNASMALKDVGAAVRGWVRAAGGPISLD